MKTFLVLLLLASTSASAEGRIIPANEAPDFISDEDWEATRRAEEPVHHSAAEIMAQMDADAAAQRRINAATDKLLNYAEKNMEFYNAQSARLFPPLLPPPPAPSPL